MKNTILFLWLFLLLPFGAYASDDIQLLFERHCEEGTQCLPEIPVEDEVQVLDVPVQTEVSVDLVIKNPKRQPITSVRAKLSYDPKQVAATDLKTRNSLFPLAAPGEDDIDPEKGTITIGRSLTGGNTNDPHIFIGTIVFRPLSEEAKISFLNFQQNELGDTGIIFTQGISTKNLLQKSPIPLQLGKKAVPSPGVPQPSVPVEPVVTPPEPAEVPSPSIVGLPRPENVRIKADADGKITLLWDMPDDPRIQGFYVYYSEDSGRYLRRRDVGKTNIAEFTNFQKGVKYYFAITAYDSQNNESDYSDEVSAIIGQPGSESHPFTGDPRNPTSPPKTEIPKPPKKLPTTPTTNTDTGPAHLAFFFLVSAGAVLVTSAFRRPL